MPNHLENFELQVLNEHSNSGESEEVESVAAALSKVAKVIYGVIYRSIWNGFKGVPVVQVFPNHITMYLFQYCFDMQLFRNAKHILCT